MKNLNIIREDNEIRIEGLKGTVYQRGKDSYKIVLSLGKRNAEGKYEPMRETVREIRNAIVHWNLELLKQLITSRQSPNGRAIV